MILWVWKILMVRIFSVPQLCPRRSSPPRCTWAACLCSPAGGSRSWWSGSGRRWSPCTQCSGSPHCPCTSQTCYPAPACSVLQFAEVQAVGRAGDGDILHLLDQVVGGGVAVVVGEGAAQGALGCGTATTSCASSYSSATSTPSWGGGGDYRPAAPTFVAVASFIIAIVSSIAVILCGSVRCLLRGFRGVCR